MSIILELFVPYPSFTFLVSALVFLAIYSMICFFRDAIASIIVLVFFSVEENPLLSISYFSWLVIFLFGDSISRFNPSISDIRRIYGGMPVNSGVSSVLFKGWAIHANYIISLGMSLKIGNAHKGHFSWSMDFNFSWWKQIVVNRKICLLIYFSWDGSISWDTHL